MCILGTMRETCRKHVSDLRLFRKPGFLSRQDSCPPAHIVAVTTAIPAVCGSLATRRRPARPIEYFGRKVPSRVNFGGLLSFFFGSAQVACTRPRQHRVGALANARPPRLREIRTDKGTARRNNAPSDQRLWHSWRTPPVVRRCSAERTAGHDRPPSRAGCARRAAPPDHDDGGHHTRGQRSRCPRVG
jgi:hypothetical protein